MLLHGVRAAEATRRDLGELLDVRPHREGPPPRAGEDHAADALVGGNLLEAFQQLGLELVGEGVQRRSVQGHGGEAIVAGPAHELTRCLGAHVVCSFGVTSG